MEPKFYMSVLLKCSYPDVVRVIDEINLGTQSIALLLAQNFVTYT